LKGRRSKIDWNRHGPEREAEVGQSISNYDKGAGPGEKGGGRATDETERGGTSTCLMVGKVAL